MLVCKKCFKREIKWADGETDFNWCDKCVPRGCSCNEEYIFYETNKEQLENNFKKILKSIEIKKRKYKIKVMFSKTGVSYNEKENKYILILNQTNFKEIEVSKLKNSKFINKFINNKKNVLKIIDLDKKGRELPCIEIMFLQKSIRKTRGETFFSLEHNKMIKIDTVYENGSFRGTINNDYSNPIYYPKTGFIWKENTIDLLINENYKENKLINQLLFNTYDSKFIRNLINLSKKEQNQIDELNEDLSYLFELQKEEKNKYKDLIKKIKKEIKKEISLEYNFSKKEIKKLFKLLFKFHTLNKDIKYTINSNKKKLKKRKKIFIKILKLIFKNHKGNN
jgi:hypothetical protein